VVHAGTPGPVNLSLAAELVALLATRSLHESFRSRSLPRTYLCEFRCSRSLQGLIPMTKRGVLDCPTMNVLRSSPRHVDRSTRFHFP